MSIFTVPPELARLAMRLEELKVMARALGVSDDQFEMIMRHVNDEAMVSPLWGTSNERLDEIKRRVRMQSLIHNQGGK